MRELLEHLLDGGHLTEAQAENLLHKLAEGAVPPAQAGAILAALRAKGETETEVRGFAMAMRDLAVQLPRSPGEARPLVDTCGTGGDGSGSLNLSTAVALLAAGCGAAVVKHGNRSISSKSGSADVLEAIGVPVGLSVPDAARCLGETGFTFLFAPNHHPAMKAIMPIRRGMGIRTVFNVLGPLTNPARPPYQVVGAFSAHAARTMARALAGMDVKRAFVVHGARGWDEATPVGPFLQLHVHDGMVEENVIDPGDHGVPRCTEADLAGGDAATNAARMDAVLRGQEAGPHRDAVTLGAGLVLQVTGLANGLSAGIQAASDAIDAGRGAAVLDSLQRFVPRG